MGLGLAIVRRFADLLGHEIALDVARGARFALPRADAARRGAGRAARAGRAPERRSTRMHASAFAGRLVAVVDDDPATVDAMRTLFETWGATVVGGDTPDALLATSARSSAIRTSSSRTCGSADNRSGIDAVRRLRDELGFASRPCIVSGDTGTRADREARAAGLMLLPKPVVGATLRAAAIALLTRNCALAALAADTLHGDAGASNGRASQLPHPAVAGRATAAITRLANAAAASSRGTAPSAPAAVDSASSRPPSAPA